MAVRLAGMADGARVPVDSLYLFHLLEAVPIPLDGDVAAPPLSGCTAVALGARCCTENEPVISHNFDLMPVSRQFFSLRKSGGAGRHRAIQFSFAALGGTIDGINEAGLCITYNFAPVCDANLSHPPVSCSIDDALSHCRSVSEAVQRITAHPRGGGAMLMLADAEGSIASLELSGTRHQCRRPRFGRDRLAHTNEFLTRCMRRVEPHRCAVFGLKSPEPLRGRPLYRSPVMRRKRLQRLLRGRIHLAPEELRQMMSDHGRRGEGSDDTICMHGGYWSTLASIELYPVSRRLRIAYAAPCQAQYVEFEV